MSGKSLEEVEQQIRILQAEAEELRLAEGIEQLRAVIRKYKLGLPHFRIAVGADGKRRHAAKKLSPTHRNPDNPAQTWSGRGRKPRWLVAALDAGMIEQCRIGHPAPADTLQPHQSAMT